MIAVNTCCWGQAWLRAKGRRERGLQTINKHVKNAEGVTSLPSSLQVTQTSPGLGHSIS